MQRAERCRARLDEVPLILLVKIILVLDFARRVLQRLGRVVVRVAVRRHGGNLFVAPRTADLLTMAGNPD